MLVITELDEFGAVYSSGNALTSDEVETCLRVFLKSSDAFSLFVRRHREGS